MAANSLRRFRHVPAYCRCKRYPVILCAVHLTAGRTGNSRCSTFCIVSRQVGQRSDFVSINTVTWVTTGLRGECVCVVGEWDGDTAEPNFTAQLLAGFRLADRCALPNWSDTAHELTVWERRTDNEQSQLQVLVFQRNLWMVGCT